MIPVRRRLTRHLCPEPETQQDCLNNVPLQGGFHTTLDSSGQPVLAGASGDKYLVPAARQVYAIATLALKAPGDGRGAALARRAHGFLTGSALWDPAAQQFNWQASGQPPFFCS